MKKRKGLLGKLELTCCFDRWITSGLYVAHTFTGEIDVWDFLFKQSEPAMTLQVGLEFMALLSMDRTGCLPSFS